jgi:hypothetical protein
MRNLEYYYMCNHRRAHVGCRVCPGSPRNDVNGAQKFKYKIKGAVS